MNISNFATRQVIGYKDRGYSSTDHRQPSTTPLIKLQTFSYLAIGGKTDIQIKVKDFQ
jgi:hypothetical protein